MKYFFISLSSQNDRLHIGHACSFSFLCLIICFFKSPLLLNARLQIAWEKGFSLMDHRMSFKVTLASEWLVADLTWENILFIPDSGLFSTIRFNTWWFTTDRVQKWKYSHFLSSSSITTCVPSIDRQHQVLVVVLFFETLPNYFCKTFFNY